jgi:type I restriction enzyme S subunit
VSRLPATWAECSIGDAVAPIQLVDPRKSPEVVFTYVDIGAIDNKSQEIVDPKRIAGAKAPSRARRQIKAGDTLFSTVRTYLRNIALVPLSLNDCVTSTGICVLRPLPGINPTYLFNWVRSNAFIDAMSHAMDGTMYPAVRDSDVLGGNLPLAPTAEQDRIVAKTIAL